MAETGIGVLSLALFGGALAIGGWVYYRRRKRRMGLGGIDTVRRIARENGCSNIAGLRR
jgi:LPXTG-motif cell wall-anchored protein